MVKTKFETLKIGPRTYCVGSTREQSSSGIDFGSFLKWYVALPIAGFVLLSKLLVAKANEAAARGEVDGVVWAAVLFTLAAYGGFILFAVLVLKAKKKRIGAWRTWLPEPRTPNARLAGVVVKRDGQVVRRQPAWVSFLPGGILCEGDRFDFFLAREDVARCRFVERAIQINTQELKPFPQQLVRIYLFESDNENYLKRAALSVFIAKIEGMSRLGEKSLFPPLFSKQAPFSGSPLRAAGIGAFTLVCLIGLGYWIAGTATKFVFPETPVVMSLCGALLGLTLWYSPIMHNASEERDKKKLLKAVAAMRQ